MNALSWPTAPESKCKTKPRKTSENLACSSNCVLSDEELKDILLYPCLSSENCTFQNESNYLEPYL